MNLLDLLKSVGPGAQQFVSGHKHWLLIVGLSALLFGGGMAAGRYLTPPDTVTKEKIVTQIQDRIVTQVQTVVKTVYVKDKQQEAKTHTVTTVVEGPGGTKTTTITKDTDTATKTQTNANTDTSKNQVQTEVKYVDRVVEKVVTVTANKQPNWRVAAGAGIAIPYFLGQGSPGIPGLSGAVINLELDRKIVGPFFLGIQANSQGVLGLNLSGVF